VAFLPAEETFLQLTMLMIVLQSTLMLQIKVWPWCTEEFNLVDGAQTACILGMVIASFAFSGNQADTYTAQLAGGFVIGWYYYVFV